MLLQKYVYYMITIEKFIHNKFEIGTELPLPFTSSNSKYSNLIFLVVTISVWFWDVDWIIVWVSEWHNCKEVDDIESSEPLECGGDSVDSAKVEGTENHAGTGEHHSVGVGLEHADAFLITLGELVSVCIHGLREPHSVESKADEESASWDVVDDSAVVLIENSDAG